jgi:uncharacterized membrane protein
MSIAFMALEIGHFEVVKIDPTSTTRFLAHLTLKWSHFNGDSPIFMIFCMEITHMQDNPLQLKLDRHRHYLVTYGAINAP